MKKVDLEIILYLEGYRVPIKSYSITVMKNNLSIVTISLPSTNEIASIEPGTAVEIFYWDNYTSVYRLAFNGRITSPTYTKTGGVRNRGLTAVGHTSILNELPTKYLLALEDMDFYQIIGSYEFYHMDTNTAMKAKLDQDMFGDYSLFTDERTRITVVEYFTKFLNLISNSWEYFYRNQDKLFKITNDHIFFDDGLFKKYYKAEALSNFLNVANQRVALGNKTILDKILAEITKVGYAYFTVSSPAYNKDAVDNKSLGEEVTIKVNAESLAQYVLMPELLNTTPPRCNIIVSGSNSNLNTAIHPPSITRLKYLFKIFDNASLQEDYPPEIKTNKYKFTGIEKKIGMKAQIVGKNYLFHQIMGKSYLNPDEVDEEKESDIYQKVTKYNFLKIQYQNNRIQLQLPEYIPYIVTGLPGIILDTTSRTIYYGTIESYSTRIDQNNGSTGTEITMFNAREINSLDDIGELNPFLRENIFGGDHISDNCYNYLLRGSNNVAVNCSETGLIRYYENLGKNSEAIAKEIRFLLRRKAAKYEGYKAIESLEGMYSVDICDKEFNEDRFNRREIVTFGEYYTIKGFMSTRSGAEEIYERKYIDPLNDVVTGSKENEVTYDENAEAVVDKKAFYIKERREAVRNLLAAYKFRIME